LQEKEGLSLKEIADILTRKSGLLGVSGVSYDMRSILQAIDSGNDRARLAVDLFCYRLARALLGLAAGLERIDGLIFTGGIGENSAIRRFGKSQRNSAAPDRKHWIMKSGQKERSLEVCRPLAWMKSSLERLLR
jgi:acetate kinase